MRGNVIGTIISIAFIVLLFFHLLEKVQISTRDHKFSEKVERIGHFVE